jgi:predicted esterase
MRSTSRRPMICTRSLPRGIGALMTLASLTQSVGSLSAQSASQNAPPSSAAMPATIARVELAAAYLRLDRAYAAATLDDAARDSVNRQFDRSTLSFFAGRFAASIAAIDSATTRLTGRPIAPDAPPAARLVNGRAPSITREALLARLAKLDTTGPLMQAIVSARARTQLLVDAPSRERSAEFMADPIALARDLVREVAVLERGRNPYVGQAGDAWHVFRGAKGALIPMRIVAPAAAATSSAPVPVVIALHGAGGDENMFVNAYGQGILARMALAANAILVTPLTTDFGQSPEHFDSLMTVLRSEYRINSGRIYVLGHSMGAGAAARLAQLRPTQITAVACLAGGSAVKVEKAPPILFIGAALDPIIPASRVQDAAKGTPTGLYRLIEHEGHTLMVAAGVKQALPWLLEHRP